jgi:hypothetical protein
VIVDFLDPASIAAWYRVAPDLHGPQLAALKRVQPKYAEAITAAGELLRAERQAAKPSQAETSAV